MGAIARLFFWLLLLALGAAMGYVAAKLIPSNENATIITAHQDWRLVCPSENEQACHADQDLIDERSGVALAHLSISGSSGARRLVITLSHDLLIPPGIVLKVGDGPAQPFPYAGCNRVGCLVPISMNATGEENFRGAERGSIAVVNSENKTAMIPFSLRGVGSALDEMDRTQSARTHWWLKIFS